MALKLAYNSLGWGPYPDLRTMLQEIKEAGWAGWEVRQPLDWLGTAEQTLATVEEVGLPAAAVCGQALRQGDWTSVEINKRRIDLTRSLEADAFLFMGLPRQRGRAVSKEEMDWLAKAAWELSEYGARVGVDVTFHPHTGQVGQARREWEQLMEAAPQLKFCFDVAHVVLAGDDVDGVFADFRDRIAYAHLQDFRLWAFVNLGQGTLYDIPATLRKFDGIGYDRWVAVHGGDYEETTHFESARRCREYLRSVGY